MTQKWTRKDGEWIVEYLEQDLPKEIIPKPAKSKKTTMFKKELKKVECEQTEKKPVGRFTHSIKSQPSIVISEARRAVKRDRIRESMGLPEFEE